MLSVSIGPALDDMQKVRSPMPRLLLIVSLAPQGEALRTFCLQSVRKQTSVPDSSCAYPRFFARWLLPVRARPHGFRGLWIDGRFPVLAVSGKTSLRSRSPESLLGAVSVCWVCLHPWLLRLPNLFSGACKNCLALGTLHTKCVTTTDSGCYAL